MALILASLILMLTADLATAQDAMRLAMARVRLTTDPKVPVGCTTLGNDSALNFITPVICKSLHFFQNLIKRATCAGFPVL